MIEEETKLNITPDMKPTLKQLTFRLLFVKRFLNESKHFGNKDLLLRKLEKSERDIIDECIRMYEDKFKTEFGDR